MTRPLERIGFTGHQGLTEPTKQKIREEIRRELVTLDRHLAGLSSLAEGADQIFAELIIETGGELTAVVPSERYESTFDDNGLQNFERLLKLASSVITLNNAEPNEEAFWSAGKYVVDNSDRVIAVWNGDAAGGLGGTADVVAYARENGKAITVIWPDGAERK